MKQRIISIIQNWVGYSEEKRNLIAHIDSFGTNVVILPTGRFKFNMTTTKGQIIEPITFYTEVERNRFSQGLQAGVALMGGQTSQMTKAQQKEFADMDAKTTHEVKKGGKLN